MKLRARATRKWIMIAIVNIIIVVTILSLIIAYRVYIQESKSQAIAIAYSGEVDGSASKMVKVNDKRACKRNIVIIMDFPRAKLVDNAAVREFVTSTAKLKTKSVIAIYPFTANKNVSGEVSNANMTLPSSYKQAGSQKAQIDDGTAAWKLQKEPLESVIFLTDRKTNETAVKLLKSKSEDARVVEFGRAKVGTFAGLKSSSAAALDSKFLTQLLKEIREKLIC